MRIIAITGTALAFPRLVDALTDYARSHPEDEVFVQFGHASPIVAPPNGPDGPDGLDGAAFVPREGLLSRMAKADAVVCHAGSGTIQDAVRHGHVPVLMPRRTHLGEHVDDHQLDVAQAMANAGRARVIGDRLTGRALRNALADAIADVAQRRGPPLAALGEGFVSAVTDAVEACAKGAPPTASRTRPLALRALRIATRTHPPRRYQG